MRAAGVPMERMVAGVAMGMLLDETGGGGAPITLTDILHDIVHGILHDIVHDYLPR